MKKKKTIAKKKVAPVAKPVKAAPAHTHAANRFNPWSLSIYIYWFIIIFFVSATFYILGRGYGLMNPTADNAQISEETLVTANEYYDLGRQYLVSGDIDGAIENLSVSIESGANLVDAYIMRGEAYMQSGDYNGAMADFDMAITTDPLNAVAFYDRALLYSRLENYSNALADVNSALAAVTQRPSDILQLRDIYAKRGQLNLWLKNWDGAIADFTNSLARPEGIVNPSVYADRAEAYTALEDYANAINDYMTAVRIISEQIQGATAMEVRESLSRDALGYFEKSAALNVRLGNMTAAKTDLESAYTIAVALNDGDTMERLASLIAEL